ncbi:MAG: NYN domain-containing protein, partial [Oligosphaeraceae bacterium]|nr:NYN domain-containing protein [Oligosphaeraceae bacterium]
MTQKTQQFALLMDVESFLDSINTDSSLSVGELITGLEQRLGRVVYRQALADWSNAKLRKLAQECQRQGVEMLHVIRSQSKNFSDVVLSAQALECQRTHANLNGFILATGEADLLPLVTQLKAFGSTVVALTGDSSPNSLWIRQCDEYIQFAGSSASSAPAPATAGAPAPAVSSGSSRNAGGKNAGLPVIPPAEKSALLAFFKEHISTNGLMMDELTVKLKEQFPDFTPELVHCRNLAEVIKAVGGKQFQIAETDEGVIVSSAGERNASPLPLEELRRLKFADYMQVTRWYIEDGNIRDRVLHNIYALFEDKGRVLTNDELHNLVDPDHIVDERPWHGTIFSLVYGACLWESPEDSNIPLPRRHLALFRTVKDEEDFLIRYYTSLFHKAYTERPDLTARMCAELMHPDS